MQLEEKIPIELSIEINTRDFKTTRMKKVVYASFVPQHGMSILDTEIVFRVTTQALAGLSGLKFTAFPQRSYGKTEGSKSVTKKLTPLSYNEMEESIEFFLKKGWKAE